MVADAVRIIDNYIKVSLPLLLALALVQRHISMDCHLLETQRACPISVVNFVLPALPFVLCLLCPCWLHTEGYACMVVSDTTDTTDNKQIKSICLASSIFLASQTQISTCIYAGFLHSLGR